MLHSFLWPNNNLFFYTCHVLFIPSPVDGHLDCFHFGTNTNNAAIYKFSRSHTFSVLLGGYLGVELLDCGNFMFNILRSCPTFPQRLHHFTFPAVFEGASSPYPGQHLSLSFYLGHPSSVK